MIDWRARRRDIYHSNSLSDCDATCRWGILCFILIFYCFWNRSSNLNDSGSPIAAF
jgi:hypothetical protein